MDTHHPRGSACNRLTAHLTLVYTTLPENHPVHDHVVRQCKEGPTCHENANGIDIPNPPSHVTQPPTPTSNFNHTPSPTRFPSESAEFVVDSASAPSGTHEGEISTRCVAELWRLFVRRFPILSVYRPVWNDRLAAETIRVPLDPQPENATPKKKKPEVWGSLTCCGSNQILQTLIDSLVWPTTSVERMAAVSLVVRRLYPDQRWDQWSAESVRQIR